MLWGVFYVLNDHVASLAKCCNLLSPKGIIVIGDDAKRRIDKNHPGSRGMLYNISKLCKQSKLYEIMDFMAYLRVTILSEQPPPYVSVSRIIKGKNNKRRK